MKQVSEADSGKSSAWKVTVLSREEQYDLKRKVLIQEAARAFSTRGYHATSLADVARELGVTKGALYYYVKSKQDILFECHVNSIALGDRAIEGSVAKIVKLEHAWRRLDGRNDDGFQVAPFPG